MRRVLPLAFALLLPLPLAGCPQLDTGHVATERLLAELDCPEEETEVEQVGAYRYRGEGCGGVVTVACTASSLEPRCLPERTAGGVDPGPEPDPGPGPEPRPGPGPEPGPDPERPGPDPEIEASVRSGLDARRDDVLACAARDRVAVHVAYAPDGSVAITLGGDLEGSPEEGCVADVLDGVRVAPGHAGTVIHLVTAEP